MDTQNICVRTLLLKIRILQTITGIRKRQPSGISTKLVNGLLQRQRVSSTLRHLLSVQHEMPIRPHTAGPLVLGEKSSVVVQAEGQVVRDEVLCRGADVQRIEVAEFVLECVCLFLGKGGRFGEGAVAEDIFPNLVRHLVRCDTKRSRCRTLNVGYILSINDRLLIMGRRTVEKLSNGVVAHIDGRVTKGLDKEGRIPRQFGTKSISPSTCPFIEPIQSLLESMASFRGIGIHLLQQAELQSALVNGNVEKTDPSVCFFQDSSP